MKATNYTINNAETEFVVAALEEIGVKNYTIQRNNDYTIINADISHRLFKKVKRIAWVLRLSKETGVRHVCRDELGMNISGIIPEEEEYFFLKNEF